MLSVEIKDMEMHGEQLSYTQWNQMGKRKMRSQISWFLLSSSICQTRQNWSCNKDMKTKEIIKNWSL